MLNGACRRFRARFTPGAANPHRRACPECEAYATSLESAAGARLPLPAGLRKNLRAIAGPEPGAALPFAAPRLEVPDSLARRLRSIAPPARPAPPEWVRSPRYALAASALLAMLLGPFLQTAAHRGIEAVDAVEARVSPVLEKTEELRHDAEAAYDATRRSFESSLGRFDRGISDVSEWFSNLKTTHPSRRSR
jgi:hypothetical protein